MATGSVSGARVRRAAACLIALAVLVVGRAQAGEDGWAFSLAPYLWLPNVNGTLSYSVPSGAAGSPQVGVGPSSYLENLESVLMLSGVARNGRWSILTDVIYLSFASEASSVKAVNFGGSLVDTNLDVKTRSSFKGTAWTLAGGYAVVQSPEATLDAIGGFRYFGIKASSDWQLTATVSGPQGGTQVFAQSGSISQRTDLWDAIVGVRGRVKLGEGSWFVPYYLDAGSGSSAWTSQGLAGLGYAYSSWGEVQLAYRYLYYDQRSGGLLQNFRFAGPTLGAVFHF